jgi:hypothetical protein
VRWSWWWWQSSKEKIHFAHCWVPFLCLAAVSAQWMMAHIVISASELFLSLFSFLSFSVSQEVCLRRKGCISELMSLVRHALYILLPFLLLNLFNFGVRCGTWGLGHASQALHHWATRSSALYILNRHLEDTQK